MHVWFLKKKNTEKNRRHKIVDHAHGLCPLHFSLVLTTIFVWFSILWDDVYRGVLKRLIYCTNHCCFQPVRAQYQHTAVYLALPKRNEQFFYSFQPAKFSKDPPQLGEGYLVHLHLVYYLVYVSLLLKTVPATGYVQYKKTCTYFSGTP